MQYTHACTHTPHNALIAADWEEELHFKCVHLRIYIHACTTAWLVMRHSVCKQPLLLYLIIHTCFITTRKFGLWWTALHYTTLYVCNNNVAAHDATADLKHQIETATSRRRPTFHSSSEIAIIVYSQQHASSCSSWEHTLPLSARFLPHSLHAATPPAKDNATPKILRVVKAAMFPAPKNGV